MFASVASSRQPLLLASILAAIPLAITCARHERGASIASTIHEAPPEATCGLVLAREGPVATAPVAGASATALDPTGRWAVWADYRNATGPADLPELVGRGLDPTTDDLALGKTQHAGSVLVEHDHVLAARLDETRQLAIHEIRDRDVRAIATLGERAHAPALARSGDTVAAFWLEDRDFPRLQVATRTATATGFTQPLVLSEPPFVIRARVTAVPGGFAAAWTQLEDEVWFARIELGPTGEPSIAWRTKLHSPTIWPAIDVEELGELAFVDGELLLPLLKAAGTGCTPDTHVLRVALDGTVRPHVVLPRSPFYAATASSLGFTLVSAHDDRGEVCVRRFDFDGREHAPPSCVPAAGMTQGPNRDEGHAHPMDLHSTAHWHAGALYVGSLELIDGITLPTLRELRCD